MNSEPATLAIRPETAIGLRSRFRAAFLSVAPAMFLGSIDQTIIAAALPVIARSFGGLGGQPGHKTECSVHQSAVVGMHFKLAIVNSNSTLAKWHKSYVLGVVGCTATSKNFP